MSRHAKRWSVLSLASLLLLSGCGTSGGGTDPCLPWAPIYVSRADVMSDGTARAILAHNETGARLCGWSRS